MTGFFVTRLLQSMSKNKQARQARAAALKAAQATSGGRAGDVASAGGCRWPSDIEELADRIQQAPSAVSNHDRDLVARMLPLGSVTRRDGSSIRPRYRDSVDF